VCCSALQCVAVCCSVLQCVVVCCRRVLQRLTHRRQSIGKVSCIAVCRSVLQCVEVCCRVLQCAVVCCRRVLERLFINANQKARLRVLHWIAEYYSVKQCVAAYCRRMLQCRDPSDFVLIH